MCNLETEGTKFGCGHYKITKQLRKIDCGSRHCKHSVRHPNPCPNCSCENYLGPDKSETVTAVSTDYCPHCAYWFQGRR